MTYTSMMSKLCSPSHFQHKDGIKIIAKLESYQLQENNSVKFDNYHDIICMFKR